ncbi:MAG: hypothetical protein L0211_02905 [Planctomycetaceae bacterium]|nr:hypothetical protein [Planctomycetaceae bacterium]
MRWLTQIISLSAVVALGGVLMADALLAQQALQQGAVNSAAPAAQRAKDKQPLSFTPEREAAALNFVDRNHPELTELLAHLKNSQPKQYEQAIKEIYRVTERLAGIQERDVLHYELEVKLWTAQSRVQLLAARLKMDNSESLKKELRDALAAQVDARLDVLKHQKQMAAQRLAKMEGDITQLEGNREKAIERQLDMLSRGAGSTGVTKAGKANKKAVRNTGKKAADKKAVE